ncbi:hypothetical protein [Roseateles sp. BYS87W]|uniref:Solute-binding protein family 3/N-terminal domain-containing protein n=1 Tax=Pelomonas baiyunensis TaxID=3299026 RepID=A0ABW7GYT9_9BURK
MRVHVPVHGSRPDPQLPYVRQLIQLALQHAGRTAELVDVPTEMSQTRSLAEVAQGTAPNDIMWTMTDRFRESCGLLPVRVPIDRGLLGWRVLLVRRSDLALWEPVRSLAALRQHRAGQGHDWPDTTILRANGLPVATGSHYEALFRMLGSGRFDYFPRSVLEIDAELAVPGREQLAVVPRLALHYPAATYFFVAPTRPDLAEALSTGLGAAARDGSFQQLHDAYYGPIWREHLPPGTTVLTLNNPTLSFQTPLNQRAFWIEPPRS